MPEAAEENATCPACGNDENESGFLGFMGDLGHWRCRACGYVFSKLPELTDVHIL